MSKAGPKNASPEIGPLVECPDDDCLGVAEYIGRVWRTPPGSPHKQRVFAKVHCIRGNPPGDPDRMNNDHDAIHIVPESEIKSLEGEARDRQEAV